MKPSLTFFAQIPDTRKAFEIPGSRAEARLILNMTEDQVPVCLPLVLLRGRLFDMSFQMLEPISAKELKEGQFPFRKFGKPLETVAAISARDSAIKINGADGMSVIFAIPTINEVLLVSLLRLRERYLQVTVFDQLLAPPPGPKPEKAR